MNNARKISMAAIVVAAAMTLTACSSTGSGGMDHSTMEPSTGATFNEADVTFAQMMVPHHEQAVDMSDMILSKEGIDEQVSNLASQIKDAQEPEIEQLNEWLDSWGAAGSMNEMDHGSEGMMSDADFEKLQDSSGNEAATLYLEQMIMHHEGAVEMAQIEIDEGKNPDAIEMAEAIVATQSEEISVMENLLGSL